MESGHYCRDDECTKLSSSFKNTIRKFEKEDIINDIVQYGNYILVNFRERMDTLGISYRLKSKQSALMKYDKYFPNVEYDKCFNDILGIRCICKDYNVINNINCENIKIVDMRNGKRKDDGYRAIHLYYQLDRKHYPTEIQLVTKRDQTFNEWLHKYVYKYKSSEIGIRLKVLYDSGVILDENEFLKEMERTLE